MKVFISWSGERSKALAEVLREWLPLVLHFVEPWLSEADIPAGERWQQVVAKELEASKFGITCITPENLAAPWILFEAGALAKSLSSSRVVPLLFDLEFSDITGPLAQFQAKKVDQQGALEVVRSINQAAENQVTDDRLNSLFELSWDRYHSKIEAIQSIEQTQKQERNTNEILEELVTGVRGLDNRFIDFEHNIDRSRRSIGKRMKGRFHPMMVDEMMFGFTKDASDPIGLLMFGSLVRDDFPWLYEICAETYKDMRSGDRVTGQRALERLRQVTRMSSKGFFDEFGKYSSKEEHMMMMELPMILDHYIHRLMENTPDELSSSKDDNDAEISKSRKNRGHS